MEKTWKDTESSLEDTAERDALYAVLDSFRLYRRTAHRNVTHRKRQNFYAIPRSHQEILSAAGIDLRSKFNAVDDAIDANADVAEQILASGLEGWGISSDDTSWHGAASAGDVEKARSIVRLFFRDWSVEGEGERMRCYGPMLEALDDYAKNVSQERLRVCIPGAGLARLLLEVCLRGHIAQGSELSLHALIASNWALNGLQEAKSLRIYPWALNFADQVSFEKQMRSVLIPDILASEATASAIENETIPPPAEDRMSMVAGDFCETHSDAEKAESFDAVATAYFIDTARSVVEYVRTIHHVLKKGGVWVNSGPLHWHFDSEGLHDHDHEEKTARRDDGEEIRGAYELTAEEVRKLVVYFGFTIDEWRVDLDGEYGYITDTQSLQKSSYGNLFFVARKS